VSQTTSAAASSPASSTKPFAGKDLTKLAKMADFDQKYTVTTNAKGEIVISPKK